MSAAGHLTGWDARVEPWQPGTVPWLGLLMACQAGRALFVRVRGVEVLRIGAELAGDLFAVLLERGLSHGPVLVNISRRCVEVFVPIGSATSWRPQPHTVCVANALMRFPAPTLGGRSHLDDSARPRPGNDQRRRSRRGTDGSPGPAHGRPHPADRGMGRGPADARQPQGGTAVMTAYPHGSSQAGALEVLWGELGPELRHGLRAVPPQGLARSRPHSGPSRAVQCLREVRQLPGRSEHTPRQARTLVAETCRRWHMSRGIVEDLTLIVSELATNAVQHAPNERVTVALLLTAREVWAVVIDQGPRHRAEPRQAEADGEHGRGLHLVEALAHQCGTAPARRGTAAWACLQLPARRLPAASTPALHTPTQDHTDSPHISEDAPDGPRTHP